MEAKRIEVVKDWLEPKLVCNIQVFLGFANIYRQFIQGFSRIAASLTLILKTIAPLKRSTSNRLEVSDNKGSDSFGDNGVELAKKSEKLKGQNLAKSQKLSRSRKSKGEKSKKLSKGGNSPNFDAKDIGPSFLTPKARVAFNYLRIAFTKAPIF